MPALSEEGRGTYNGVTWSNTNLSLKTTAVNGATLSGSGCVGQLFMAIPPQVHWLTSPWEGR